MNSSYTLTNPSSLIFLTYTYYNDTGLTMGGDKSTELSQTTGLYPMIKFHQYIISYACMLLVLYDSQHYIHIYGLRYSNAYIYFYKLLTYFSLQMLLCENTNKPIIRYRLDDGKCCRQCNCDIVLKINRKLYYNIMCGSYD